MKRDIRLSFLYMEGKWALTPGQSHAHPEIALSGKQRGVKRKQRSERSGTAETRANARLIAQNLAKYSAQLRQKRNVRNLSALACFETFVLFLLSRDLLSQMLPILFVILVC